MNDLNVAFQRQREVLHHRRVRLSLGHSAEWVVFVEFEDPLREQIGHQMGDQTMIHLREHLEDIEWTTTSEI